MSDHHCLIVYTMYYYSLNIVHAIGIVNVFMIRLKYQLTLDVDRFTGL